MPGHSGSSSAHRFPPLSSPFKLILSEVTQREVMISIELTVLSMRYLQGVCLLGEEGQEHQAMEWGRFQGRLGLE